MQGEFASSVVRRGYTTSAVAWVESVRSRHAESERHPVRDGAGVNGLFESMLSESFA